MKTGMTSLTRKFTGPLAVGVIATCVGMMAVLALMLVERENAQLLVRTKGYSRLLTVSLTFAMSNGVTDVSPIEESLRHFNDIDAFRLVPVTGMSSRDHPQPDQLERAVLSKGEVSVDVLEDGGKGRLIRITSPIPATETCSACHAGVVTGQVVAVTSMFLSTADARNFIGVFAVRAVLLTLAATLILIGVVWTTLRLVVIKPLHHMRDLIEDIAKGQGDLTRRVTIASKDEVGEVAGLVNSFVDQTHDVVLGIRRFSARNAANAESLGSTAERARGTVAATTTSIEAARLQLAEMVDQNGGMSASAAEILSGITALSGQIDEQAKAVTQSSSAFSEMSASIESVARVAERKLGAANELLVVTRRGGQMVGEVNAEITDIAKSVSDIGEAISLINGIAARTNLLSMNAAIEAAHAGEYGKGFAVVAEEIRHLAVSSAEKAKQVTSVLKEIIGKIQHALTASTESSGALTHIGNEVGELVQAFSEIAASTGELAEGGREILQASQSLMQVTEHISAGSVEMSRGAERISEAQAQIACISALSKAAMDDVALRAGDIDADMGNIAAMSAEGRVVGRQLDEAAGRFKVREETS